MATNVTEEETTAESGCKCEGFKDKDKCHLFSFTAFQVGSLSALVLGLIFYLFSHMPKDPKDLQFWALFVITAGTYTISEWLIEETDFDTLRKLDWPQKSPGWLARHSFGMIPLLTKLRNRLSLSWIEFFIRVLVVIFLAIAVTGIPDSWRESLASKVIGLPNSVRYPLESFVTGIPEVLQDMREVAPSGIPQNIPDTRKVASEGASSARRQEFTPVQVGYWVLITIYLLLIFWDGLLFWCNKKRLARSLAIFDGIGFVLAYLCHYLHKPHPMRELLLIGIWLYISGIATCKLFSTHKVGLTRLKRCRLR